MDQKRYHSLRYVLFEVVVYGEDDTPKDSVDTLVLSAGSLVFRAGELIP